MTTLRWIFFIPAAYVVATLIGAIINFASQVFFPEWISWAASGIASGVGFILTGLKIAPKVTKTVKWLLIIIVGIMGLLSAIGSLFGENKIAALAGILMLVSAIIIVNTPIGKLHKDA